ncbi:MAG TPA: DEAD/DEAH box helicase family protein [Terriglobia bacterium]|nr:DEAD/DEAH box helicase family protein [Terriglobia bacterium]
MPGAERSLRDLMTFQRPWRAYQSRLLNALDRYLKNSRLHLVAAPGSGKTVIGLEVVRRLNRPTLVLAPTIAIRDQWVDRLVTLFLPAGAPISDWVSIDLRTPGLLTVSTYQAIHSACSGDTDPSTATAVEVADDSANAIVEAPDDDVEDAAFLSKSPALPEHLEVARFQTLVLDEAHHLRSEWWKTLNVVASALGPPAAVVALTATPPYDVSPFEWRRYEDLCGPVDMEVGVPELVREGNLCPHQDYIYFSAPAEREWRVISEFRAAVERFSDGLRANAAFQNVILSHPWLSDPERYTEAILEDPEYLSSMVVFLHAAGGRIDSSVLQALGLYRQAIPELDLGWLETLLTRCLYMDSEILHRNEPVLKPIRRELVAIGAVERRRVRLRAPSNHLKLLTTSITKLQSIEAIVRIEANAQGADLRGVILTDFIRKSEMPQSPEDTPVFEDIGVVPIFETLRRSATHVSLGVLSGSLIIIPDAARPALLSAAKLQGIDPRDLTIQELAHDPAYATVEIRGEYYRGAVRLMTAMLEQGAITVLVGTKSLLGEGWDAPCVNALIIASFAGSFVASNQMRGRSLRSDPAQPEKVANIWHLACVEPGLGGPGPDYDVLVRRCSAFVGVGAEALTIENGVARLGFGDPPFSPDRIAAINASMRNRAMDRAGLRGRWREALNAGALKEITHGLKTPEQFAPRRFVFANTIAAIGAQAAYVFTRIAVELGRAFLRAQPVDLISAIVGILEIAAILSSPWALLALWRLVRHGTPERSIREIGQVVVDALRFTAAIDPVDPARAVYSSRRPDGTVFCWISGDGREQVVFRNALREVLGPIENPRYLLRRKRLWRFFREDYFAVPEALGRKKEHAVMFARLWKRLVGPVDLVYTRAPEGRKILLRARAHSLSASFVAQTERVSCWK